jgi:RNA polymerase sigma-70 factor (ECF subfamily)
MAERSFDPTDDLESVARRAQKGERFARELLVRRLIPRTRNLVRYLVGSDSEVDDLAQEALLAVVRGLRTFAGSGTLEAWSDRVVARSVFTALRQRKPSMGPAPLELLPDPRPPEGPGDYLARRWVARLLDGLPLERREAVVLHFVLGMTVPEIAEQTDAPQETVRSRLRLAREQLRLATGQTRGGGDDDE